MTTTEVTMPAEAEATTPARNPFLVSPLDTIPTDMPEIIPLRGAAQVVPLVDQIVGEIRCDGQAAKVLAISTLASGAVVLLNLVGPATTLGAVIGRLHGNRVVEFTRYEEIEWDGPYSLSRVVATHYTQQSVRIARIGQINLLVHPVTLAIDEGIRKPVIPSITRDKDGIPQPPSTPPAFISRFIAANEEDQTPSPERFLGTLAGMRVPFPRTQVERERWASILWAYGLATPVAPGATQRFIMPTHSLGVRAWEICGSPWAWWGLLSTLVQRNILTH